jgi:hypothetical protein
MGTLIAGCRGENRVHLFCYAEYGMRMQIDPAARQGQNSCRSKGQRANDRYAKHCLYCKIVEFIVSGRRQHFEST